MSNEFDKVNQLIKNYFEQDLISLVVFGSACRGTRFKITSDIDYIIILASLKIPQDKISRILKNKLQRSFPLVAFNIYGKNNFVKILEHNPWMVLTIELGYKIYFDKNNFFEKKIEKYFKQLKQQKIGRLSWYIENRDFDKSVLNHYARLSGKYLQAARLVYNKQLLGVAMELLLNAIHCFMIRQLLNKKIFITTGEISQLFFNIYTNANIFQFKNSFLQLEQKVNQKHSFDFNKYGNMVFLDNNVSKNKLIFERSKRDFKKIQVFFNKKNDKFKHKLREA